MKTIAQGAEAVIKSDGNTIIKDRIPKSYRLAYIDERLRKFRTRREAKVMEKLSALDFPGPKLLDACDKTMNIKMEHIQGPKVRDVLEENHEKLSFEIGKKLAVLHQNDIIHGDLTTSNMILENEIKFIDFGLSFFSTKIEDKAVDLHLLRQALESRHHTVWEDAFQNVLKGYSSYKHSTEVLKRLEQVEARGRNKHKG